VRDRKLLHRSLAGLLLLASFQVGCTGQSEAEAAAPTTAPAVQVLTDTNVWPTKEWRVVTPEQRGINSANFAKMKEYLQLRKHIRGVVIVRSGDIVFEYYRTGVNPNELQPAPAVAKVLTSGLVGTAIDRKLLNGIDQKIAPFFTEYKKKDKQFDKLTLKHLLTMTAGFRWGEKYELAEWKKSPNPMQTAVSRVIEFPPGPNFVYDTPSIHLLSKVMSKATGMSLEKHAEGRVFKPLGITEWKWPADPQGYTPAGHGLELKTRDVAKIGYLYLRKGMWEGSQLISPEWVKASTQQQTLGLYEIARYGHLWWVTTARTSDAYFAWDYSGQYLFVVPALDVVVATTADELYQNGTGDTGIVGAFIVPAIK
jgi:CubicO group peptidase (beta-lactamase class C family)